jgi:hypothetical protein
VRALLAVVCLIGGVRMAYVTYALIGLGVIPQDSSGGASGVPAEAPVAGALCVALFAAGMALLRYRRR